MLRKKCSGFTLIELLVVIAIITILAAVLFPVISSAKMSSYSSVCSSNLRQFGQAFSMYAENYSGRLPLPGGSLVGSTVWLNDSGNGNQSGALWPYIRTRMNSGAKNNFWSCPLAVKVNTSAQGYSPGQNYIMNQYIRAGFSGEANFTESYPGYSTGIIPGACPRPSRVILLYEGVQDKNGYCSRLGSPFYVQGANPLRPSANVAFTSMKYANLPQKYHNGKSNFLFLDGHVKLMSPADSLDSISYHSGVKDIKYWKQIYKSCGSEDYWNPHTQGVIYP